LIPNGIQTEGGADFVQRGEAGNPLRLPPRRGQRRKQDRYQHADHSDNDEQFHQRKCATRR
jgi:hypothetical protein